MGKKENVFLCLQLLRLGAGTAAGAQSAVFGGFQRVLGRWDVSGGEAGMQKNTKDRTVFLVNWSGCGGS
ncbi:MAG: hypothetical protein F4092_03165 [Rhodospirillaceae bacterium]|nr:hypothetical protein [Rhodospirillaceae bacterium]MYJ70768.1 hypothetical protein [Rhodospirillaceae bacterium]